MSPPRLHRWVLHPILLAAYPVLFLFAENVEDQMTFEALWFPLGAAIGGAAVLLLLGTALFRDVHRGGIAASVLVAAFFGFGHAWNLVGEFLGNQWILLAVWAVAAGIGLLVAWRVRARARFATPYLNLFVAIPLILTLVGLADFAFARASPRAVADSPGGPLAGHNAERPDIYYLIFDRYAGSRALERHFDFDNEPFLRELEARGFYVPRDSMANYPKTGLSLTSSLNMEYLDGDELNADAATPADQGVIHRRFQDHLAVPASLKELGYEFFLIPSYWTPTASNVDADITLRYEGASEFWLELVETTLAGLLATWSDEVDSRSEEFRNYTLFQLDRLREVPQVPGPQFVLAHFLIPHPPYVFDRDGSDVTAGEAADRGPEEEYLRQLEFTNTKILEMIDEIQARPSDDPPVIIIQADEGPFPARYAANGETFKWDQATGNELEIKFRILNAIRLPGVDPEDAGLYQSITPVNTFRVVLNAVFDVDLPLLDDRVYAHADYLHFYDFIDVTDEIPNWPASDP